MKLPFNFQPKRTKLQEKALKRAKEIYNSDPQKYENTMFALIVEVHWLSQDKCVDLKH